MVIEGERREKSMFSPEPIVVMSMPRTHILMVLQGLDMLLDTVGCEKS